MGLRRNGDGADTGECSIIDFIIPDMFFPLFLREVYGGTNTCGKRREGCGDP